MSSFSEVPIAEPLEDQQFIPTSRSYPTWNPPGSFRNLPGNDDRYWKVTGALAFGSFACALLLFMGTSAGFTGAAFLMVGAIAIIGITRFAPRDGNCARPMLVTLVLVLVLVCFVTLIAAIIEAKRLHIGVNDNVYKCHCDLKFSDEQCSDEADSKSHHVGYFNCFKADGTMCLLCTDSGTTRVGVSCVFMWIGWLQQAVVCGYTFFILCCYVAPDHPYANTGGATVVMGQAIVQ